MCDSQGVPLAVQITAGQRHESKSLAVVETAHTGPAFGDRQLRPRRLAADKGYDFARVRNWLAERDIAAVIPRRRLRGSVPENSFDHLTYHRRNAIERCIGWLKHCRRIATRFEKTASNFLAMIKLAFIQQYFRRHLRDTT